MTMTSTGGRRWFAPVIAALVIGLALIFAAPAGSAPISPSGSAAGAGAVINPAYTEICFPVKVGGLIVQWKCYRIYVYWPLNLPCPPRCGPGFDLTNDPFILPESVENRINELIGLGMSKLGDAAATTDPTTRATLRRQAIDAFTTAAQSSVNTRLTLRQVGVASAADNSYDTRPAAWHTWAQAAGQDIADGMAYLKQYLTTPPTVSNPYLHFATAQFDEAYTEFSQQRVIAG